MTSWPLQRQQLVHKLRAMQLTPHQQKAFEAITHFLEQKQNQVFVLKGYAGTGKTTLVSHLVGWLKKQKRSFELLATTGRAAKVLQNKTGHQAGTVHGCIYAFDEVSGKAEEGEQLQLSFNLKSSNLKDENQVFIIDEASMITHEVPEKNTHTARFGSGSLLNDLFTYADGRQVIFIGDPCQLPPIADNPVSSALVPSLLQQYCAVQAEDIELTEIIRQGVNSEILNLAGRFREDIVKQSYIKWAKVLEPRGRQVFLLKDHRVLLQQYVEHVKKHGFRDAVLIGYANWHVAQLNKRAREAIYSNWELQDKELLMVVQNSYNVNLANGDQVILEKAEFAGKRAGFTFLKVKVRALHDDKMYETLLIRDLLYNQHSGLTREEVNQLLIDFDQRMRKRGVRRKSEIYKEAMRKDPWLNALRVKFGYAVTCHKAQGGEWSKVFLNIHKSMYGSMESEQLYRWYYTALTRARDHLYVNDGWWVEGFNDRQKNR